MSNEKQLHIFGDDYVFLLSPPIDNSGICISVLMDERFCCIASVVDDGENFSLIRKRKDYGYEIETLKEGEAIPLERYKLNISSERAFRIKTPHNNCIAVFHTTLIPAKLMLPFEAMVAILKDEELIPLCVFTTIDGTLRVKIS